MLDYIDRGYDVCSGMEITRRSKWEDESESKKLYISASVIDEIRKELGYKG